MSISHLAGQRHRVAGENSPNHQQSRRTDLETGAICGYKGKNADRLVTRIDPGVVSLAAELRGHERQAAEELEPWKTHPEERKVIDASPAAVPTLHEAGLPGEEAVRRGFAARVRRAGGGYAGAGDGGKFGAGTSVQALNAAQIAKQIAN